MLSTVWLILGAMSFGAMMDFGGFNNRLITPIISRVKSAGGAIAAVMFGISTHLYHDERLNRDHLLEIKEFGFDAVEIFATRTHFDYHDVQAIDDLVGWVADSGLVLHSIHAPIVESLRQGKWGAVISNATADPARRAQAVRETDAALNIARRIPTQFLVVHLGVPTVQKPGPGDNQPDAARRSLEQIMNSGESAHSGKGPPACQRWRVPPRIGLSQLAAVTRL